MNKFIGLLAVVVLGCGFGFSAPVDLDDHPLGPGVPGLAVGLGGAFQSTDLGWDVAPTLALRYDFPRKDSDGSGPEDLSPWSLELGAVLPHAGPGSREEIVAGQPIHAKLRSYSAEHLAARYRWAVRWPVRMNPELALGVAFAQFKNEFYTYVQEGTTLTNPQGKSSQNAIGPLIRVGMPLLANDSFAFRCDVGYSHFSNSFDAFGHLFDLGIQGIAIYPSLQMNLGYLQPGVRKGTALPPSALPLWVIAALQTEKRSPIIAPPEVLLNAHQRATQGGLSGNVLFQYKNRRAEKVELLGDFNQWMPEPLYRDPENVWITVKDLPAGSYHYVLLINGKREIRDPWNTSFDPGQRARGVSTFRVEEVTPKSP